MQEAREPTPIQRLFAAQSMDRNTGLPVPVEDDRPPSYSSQQSTSRRASRPVAAQPNQQQYAARSQPEKFPDLTHFMPFARQYEQEHLVYESAARGPMLSPGDIIHIRDDRQDNSPIDKRVMLVIKTIAHFKMLCVSFCRYPYLWTDHPAQQRTHYRTHAAHHPPRFEDFNGWYSAGLVLPAGAETFLKPHPDVVINLEDIWAVEKDVHIARLGFLTKDSWLGARLRINELFLEDDSGATSPEPVLPREHPTAPAIQLSASSPGSFNNHQRQGVGTVASAGLAAAVNRSGSRAQDSGAQHNVQGNIPGPPVTNIVESDMHHMISRMARETCEGPRARNIPDGDLNRSRSRRTSDNPEEVTFIRRNDGRWKGSWVRRPGL